MLVADKFFHDKNLAKIQATFTQFGRVYLVVKYQNSGLFL